MQEEGYIKFQANWQSGHAPADHTLIQLLAWRQRLYQEKLIGVYPDGIGYGNISQRSDPENQFIITGSTTGRLFTLTAEHFTRVTHVDWQQNTLWCEGPIVASSESMSHYVIYQELSWVGGVIHVHHLRLWEILLGQVPTTKAGVPYGTPEMAASIIDLIQTTDLPERKLFVMEGHQEGIFVFGKDLEEAGEVLMGAYANV